MARARCISDRTRSRSAPFTDTISYLEDGDWVVLTRKGATIFDKDNAIVQREAIKHTTATSLVDKANYRHFMAKEIHEQPEVVGHTLARYVDMAAERVALPVKLPFDFKDIQRISITACGTASYAGYVAKYWFERFAPPAGRTRCRLRIPLPRGAACARAISRSSSRSPARPPIRWPRCATPRRRARIRSRSSTCRPRRSRARARPCCRRWPVPKSASPRPRRSPAS